MSIAPSQYPIMRLLSTQRTICITWHTLCILQLLLFVRFVSRWPLLDPGGKGLQATPCTNPKYHTITIRSLLRALWRELLSKRLKNPIIDSVYFSQFELPFLKT